jgi:hypothetical protein
MSLAVAGLYSSGEGSENSALAAAGKSDNTEFHLITSSFLREDLDSKRPECQLRELRSWTGTGRDRVILVD